MTAEVAPPTGADEGRLRDDVQPVSNESRDRIITGTVTVVRDPRLAPVSVPDGADDGRRDPLPLARIDDP